MNEKDKTRIDRLVSLLEALRWYEDLTFVRKGRFPASYSLNSTHRHQQVSYLARFTEAKDYWHPGARRLWDLIQEIESDAVFGSEGRCCVCSDSRNPTYPSAFQPVGDWRWWHCQSCWDEHLNKHYRADLCADDAIRAIFAARCEWGLTASKQPPVTPPQPPEVSPHTTQPNCTVARCPAHASALADSRLMCDMHAKQFALWQKEQNRQIEQAKADLDRPFRSRWLGSGDIGSNPWNR